jgi:cytochrome P450
MNQVSVQFIKDIYTHTSLIPALLEEIEAAPSTPPTSTTANDCLMEGVLMESMRLHCFQSTAIHRKAISPFTFSDGYTIPAGQSVQFYQERVHLDENRYAQSTIFDPQRYYGSSRSVTDVGMKWPFWGAGRNAW